MFATTLPSPDKEKAKSFYELYELLSGIPIVGKILLPGNYKGHFGKDHSTSDGVLRWHELGKCNTNADTRFFKSL